MMIIRKKFRKQRNLVTALKRKSMKFYFSQASAESAHPGEFWKKFKPLLPANIRRSHYYVNSCENPYINVPIATLLENRYHIGVTN